MSKVNLYTQLKNNEVHLGDKLVLTHKTMVPYIFKSNRGVQIINLKHTVFYFRQVMNVLKDIIKGGGSILFIGHPYNKVINSIIRYTALACGQSYLNFNLNKLDHNKLSKVLKTKNPSMVFILSPIACKAVINECYNQMIPTVGICNTSSNTEDLTYFIPGNDTSYKAAYLYCSLIKTTVENELNSK